MEMGEKIKALRLERDMTLEQLGDLVGVGKSTVRKWENGLIANMRRDKISKIAKALDVTPAYLMGWEDDLEHAGAVTDPHKTAQIGIDLNEAEASLLSDFRELNEEGQGKLTDYASDLVASGRYIKSDAPVMVAPSAGA